MRPASARQREILGFLETFSSANGMAPSIGEVAAHFGIAASTAAEHLRALQKKRLITRSGKARSIVLAGRDPADAVLKIPLYGNLTAPVSEDDRAAMLLSLRCVDYVVLFDEDTPVNLISALLPDVLVKGSDWAGRVAGAEIVEKNGGCVKLAELVAGRSTTGVIEKVLAVYGPGK